MIRITKEEKDLKYSSKIVALGKFVSVPEEYGDPFGIEFDIPKSQELLEHPLDWGRVSAYLRENIKNKPRNRTILPMRGDMEGIFWKGVEEDGN